MTEILLDIRERTGATMAIIEHDIPMIRSLSDQVVDMRRRGSNVAIVLGLATTQLCLSVGIGAAPARAASADRHGWWSRASLAPGLGVTPPDVPPEGLYVEGSPTGPVAFAALAFQF